MPELSLVLIGTAFIGGVLMFLAPCTLPLVPAFIASLVPGKQNVIDNYKRRVLQRTILFSAGFTLIFVLFGIFTGLFGSKIASYKLLLSQIGGVFIIIFGLALLNLFQIPFLTKSGNVGSKIPFQTYGSFAPLILGIVFALGWTPCAGPILASILFLASDSGTILQGGILLFIFSMGLAVPFILVGVFLGYTSKLLLFYERFHKVIGGVSGVFLITLGVFLVFGQSIVVTSWGFALYSFFGYMPMCTIM
jgi:cytochrome c-type biogenesis protein